MTMDMSRYLGLFLTEASEHLEGLGRDLVQLEREGAPAVVDSMFRHAHSVKGMASSMGFESIAVVAHRVEDLVDAIRQDPAKLERSLVDLMLSATDVMLAQVRAVADNKPPEDASALLGQLADKVSVVTGRTPGATRVLNRVMATPPAPAPVAAAARVVPEPSAAEPAPPSPAAESAPVPPVAEARVAAVVPVEAEVAPKAAARWAVRLRIAPTCQTPGVRAFLVHKRLTSLGTLHGLQPPLEDLKAGRIPEGYIQVELETAEGEEGIRKALRNVAEVELVSLKPAVVAPPPAPVPAATGPVP
ncbi:MAG TPA: Hpt domain-containing protein, partial [Archangium sp.]